MGAKIESSRSLQIDQGKSDSNLSDPLESRQLAVFFAPSSSTFQSELFNLSSIQIGELLGRILSSLFFQITLSPPFPRGTGVGWLSVDYSSQSLAPPFLAELVVGWLSVDYSSAHCIRFPCRAGLLVVVPGNFLSNIWPPSFQIESWPLLPPKLPSRCC